MTTANDRGVLNAILNPLVPLDEVVVDELDSKTETARTLTPEEETAKALESEAVSLAEKGDYGGAIDKLNQAVTACPSRISCYNNRAQVYRLMHKNKEARDDLDHAISTAEDGVSQQVLAQAFTQRALLQRLEGDDEACRRDLKEAGDRGCMFAKTQLVSMNPYAAMCNAMLTEVVGKLEKGEPTDDTDRGA